MQSLSRRYAYAGFEKVFWPGVNGVWRYDLNTGEMEWFSAHTTTLETTYDGYGVYLNTPQHVIAVAATGTVTLTPPAQGVILGWVGGNIYVKEEQERFGYVISASILSTVAWNGAGWDTIQSLRIAGPWSRFDWHREKRGGVLAAFNSNLFEVHLLRFEPNGQFSHRLFRFRDVLSGSIMYPVVPAGNGDFLMTEHGSGMGPRLFWVDGGSGRMTYLHKYEWGAGFTDYGQALVDWHELGGRSLSPVGD